MRSSATFLRSAHSANAKAINSGPLSRRSFARYRQAPTHQPNRKRIAATFDHLIPQDDPLAKNVAASRKKSRSFFTHASSRLSWASFSSRGVPAPQRPLGPGSGPHASSGSTVCPESPIPCYLCTTDPGMVCLFNCATFELCTELPSLRHEHSSRPRLDRLVSVRDKGDEPAIASSTKYRRAAPCTIFGLADRKLIHPAC